MSYYSELDNHIRDEIKVVENFAARLNQVDLVSNTDFNNKLTSFNKRITWNKKNI